MKDLYYIYNRERSQGKESAVWWKPNRCGYTTDINEAGYYTKEQAEAICKAANIMREEDVMVPIEQAQALASSSVPNANLQFGFKP